MGIGGVGLGLYGGYKGYQYFCEHMVKSYTWKDTKQLNPNVFKIVESKYNFRIPKELKEVLKVANGGYPIYKGKRLTEMVRSGIDIFGYYYKSASLQFNRFLSFNLVDTIINETDTTFEELLDYYFSKPSATKYLPFALTSINLPSTYFSITEDGKIFNTSSDSNLKVASNIYTFLWSLRSSNSIIAKLDNMF